MPCQPSLKDIEVVIQLLGHISIIYLQCLGHSSCIFTLGLPLEIQLLLKLRHFGQRAYPFSVYNLRFCNCHLRAMLRQCLSWSLKLDSSEFLNLSQLSMRFIAQPRT